MSETSGVQSLLLMGPLELATCRKIEMKKKNMNLNNHWDKLSFLKNTALLYILIGQIGTYRFGTPAF